MSLSWPGEAHREPFLLLAAVPALQCDAEQLVRQVVAEPAGRLRQNLHGANGGLLLQLAHGCGFGAFTGRDATLRHLPDVGRAIALPFRRSDDQPTPDRRR